MGTPKETKLRYKLTVLINGSAGLQDTLPCSHPLAPFRHPALERKKLMKKHRRR